MYSRCKHAALKTNSLFIHTQCLIHHPVIYLLIYFTISCLSCHNVRTPRTPFTHGALYECVVLPCESRCSSLWNAQDLFCDTESFKKADEQKSTASPLLFSYLFNTTVNLPLTILSLYLFVPLSPLSSYCTLPPSSPCVSLFSWVMGWSFWSAARVALIFWKHFLVYSIQSSQGPDWLIRSTVKIPGGLVCFLGCKGQSWLWLEIYHGCCPWLMK